MKVYTGIGSRKTPNNILEYMADFSQAMTSNGMTLRSGGAAGADTAFETGSKRNEIYIPWGNFNDRTNAIVASDLLNFDEAMTIASEVHPAWNNCSNGAKKLHARNVYQILGKDLDSPSDLVICWTPDGANGYKKKVTSKTGGTGTAITLAKICSVPVLNIANIDDFEDCENIKSSIKSFNGRLR